MFRIMLSMILGLGLMMLGCDEESSDGNDNKASVEACKAVADTVVGWTESSALGVPKEIFSPMAGICEASFEWDGSGWGSSLKVAPESGKSTLKVKVVVDESSVHLVERERNSEFCGIRRCVPYCPTTLEVEAVIELEIAEGLVVQEQSMTLVNSKEEGAEAKDISFTVDQVNFGDWITVTPADDRAEISMQFEMMPIASACAGNIMLSQEIANGSSMEGSGGKFASWSD